MKPTAGHSIAGEVRRSTRILTTALLIPAVLSLVFVLATAYFFGRMTYRMEQEAALEPLVEVTIPESVWSAVAGRVSFEECGALERIREVDASLDALIRETEGQMELEVARRTMETLERYVRAVETGIENGTPVEELQRILDEVRSVAQLIKNMLGNCITQEAQNAGRVNRSLMQIALLFVVTEIGILIFGLFISVHTRRTLQRSIREPIEQLEQVTGDLAGGHLEARAKPTDTEELRDLTAGVNRMADRIQELIRQNRTEQENLKKAELRTLQAQVNPHFLYNTLDTILWQAEEKNNQEVIHLTQALSDFFRISLSSGKDWIPVRQELRHLSGYLAIQKVRYRDVLNYEIDVDDGLYENTILKLVLQPLVENAIYHGIKERRGGGKITVSGREEAGMMVFRVTDNGTGMSPERLSALRQCLADGTDIPHAPEFPGHSGSGFGLRNVDQRIRLYYGQPEGLQIESGRQGTTVTFRVPATVKEESQDGV
ncbi:MAG: sensor histidine kinase [Clostridia bacterium]|nr:sensor histidine kinase [Clostridia bacterium]